MEDAPKKFYRLSPGRDVRLKHAFIVHCTGFKNNDAGELEEVYCTYYENSKSGSDVSGVKPKGTLHFVPVNGGVPCEVRNLGHLFTDPAPDSYEGVDFLDFVDPNSINPVPAIMEPSLVNAEVGQQFQFLRKGYYCVDPDSTSELMVFNKTTGLKGAWKPKGGNKGQKSGKK